MKMTRRFPLMAIYSKYGPVMKVCERSNLFSIKGIQKGFLFGQNGVKKGNRLDLREVPSSIELCRVLSFPDQDICRLLEIGLKMLQGQQPRPCCNVIFKSVSYPAPSI